MIPRPEKIRINRQYGKEPKPMSSALWCDKGNHAFSAKDPDRQHFTQTQTVNVPTGNSYGRTTYQDRQEVTEELDICGPCWKNTNPFQPPTAIEDAERDSQQSEADMWKARYEAERARHTPNVEIRSDSEWPK